MEAHLGVARYGDFTLTDAIRPSYDLQVVPAQGFRHDVYHDADSRCSVPVLMGSASREGLFEMFMDLLDPLGSEVGRGAGDEPLPRSTGHIDLYREHIDMPVLKSILWDYEELLLNDGCIGIAVLNPAAPLEVQFDEHKLLIVYGDDLGDVRADFPRPLDPLRRPDEVHHRGRARSLVERPLLRASSKN